MYHSGMEKQYLGRLDILGLLSEKSLSENSSKSEKSSPLGVA